MLFQVRNSRDDAKGISNISRSKGRNEYTYFAEQTKALLCFYMHLETIKYFSR